MLFHLMRLLISTDSQMFKSLYILAVIAICIVAPFVVGRIVANRIRMQDYAWKIGLILMTLLLACEIMGRTWDPEKREFAMKLGIDLKGGVILIYEVEEGVPVLAAEKRRSHEEPAAGAARESQFEMGAMIEAISRRLNPSGTKEIVVRPYGDRQVEIIIPEVDQREVEQVKKTISTAGVLQFRIVANHRAHSDIIALAEEAAKDPAKKRSRVIVDRSRGQEEIVGLWARVAREAKTVQGVQPFKLDVSGFTLRDASSGDLLTIPPEAVTAREDDTRRVQLAQYIKSRGIREIDILVAMNDSYNVTGSDLGAVARGHDEVLNPCVLFNLRGRGVAAFSDLTGEFSPEGQFHHQLGIILDNELLSAPNIQERITGSGRITGQFTQEEVDFLVNILQAGSLPAVLNKNPISENRISPLLGKETVEQGKWAISGSLLLVLIFMLVYYRFSGIVACFALLANLLFTLALMVLIKATLTLPGIAGLALTVGMAVDANVLIYERMREELARGAALRMAIRNGFNRATVTIIDSNLTTMLTAIILYAIGTDQLRGFAVTLTLGLITSMFTAVFCAHVGFDIAERTRSIAQLRMMQMLGVTRIDFMRQSLLAVTVSLVLIAVGLVAFVARGKEMFDIDFVGGTSVHLVLKEPAESEEVRRIVGGKLRAMKVQYTLTSMGSTPGATKNTIFKVDSSLPEVSQLQAAIEEAFAASPTLKLATYSLKAGTPRLVPTERPGTGTAGQPAPGPGAPKQPAEKTPNQGTSPATPAPPLQAAPAQAGAASGDTSPAKPPEGTPAAPEKATKSKNADGAYRPAGEGFLLAFADEARPPAPKAGEPAAESKPPAGSPEKPAPPAAKPARETAPAKPADGPVPTPPAGAKPKPAETAKPPAEQEAKAPTAPAAGPSPPGTLIEVPLSFGSPISRDTLRAEVEEAAKELKIPISDPELLNPNWQGGSNAFDQWTLRVAATQEQTQKVLDHLARKFAATSVWASSSKIGGQVAGRMQKTAITATVLSWLGIIIYVWIRFQRVAFGLAGVLALVHDVLITVGAIAVSKWLAGALGFLLVEEFKINLTIVAALLTIIGYSINDTIVIFDRVREIRGKSPNVTHEMINLSVNQTLGRTILTALTVFIVVVVMYAVGGEGIHGFAFAMLIGTISGAYSTVYVASPALIWLMGTSKRTSKSLAA